MLWQNIVMAMFKVLKVFINNRVFYGSVFLKLVGVSQWVSESGDSLKDQENNFSEAQWTQDIESVTWIICSDWNKFEIIWTERLLKFWTQYLGFAVPLAMFHSWFGIRCICSKCGHQVAPLTLITNLATRWRHFHQLQNWPRSGITLP